MDTNSEQSASVHPADKALIAKVVYEDQISLQLEFDLRPKEVLSGANRFCH